MELNKELVENIAQTARLKLTEEEITTLEKDMKEVLEAFSKIQEIDTENVKMSIQPVELKNALRDDEEEICLTQKHSLSQTKHKKDNYFMGPKSV